MNYEDEIYHSGYLDGYYASMELYHADDSEMTDEEKARRKKRRRKIALGVGIPVGAAVGILGGTYLYNEAKINKEIHEKFGKKPRTTVKHWKYPKDDIHGFRRNVTGSYKVPNTGTFGSWDKLYIARDRKLKRK